MAKPEVVNYLLDVTARATGVSTYIEGVRTQNEPDSLDTKISSLAPTFLRITYPAIIKIEEDRDSEGTIKDLLSSFGAAVADIAHIVGVAGLVLSGHALEAGLAKVGYNFAVEVIPDVLRSVRKIR